MSDLEENKLKASFALLLDARSIRRGERALEQRARTRSAILGATFKVIGHENGRLVRIEDVVQLARIARPTFYTYFGSIDELFAALSFELSHEFNTRVLAYASQLGDAASEAAFAIRYYLERAASDPKWGWSMVNLSVGGPIFGSETFMAATATVEWGLKTGTFSVADAHVGRDMVVGTALAAMKTILTSECEACYPAQVARQVLLGLGVSEARTRKLIFQPQPPLEPPAS
ncbi:MAG: TetR/AcrR family transcriptional regulator [Pseudomonadota bacterium]